MKARFTSLAVLITSLFLSHNGMAAEVTGKEKGEVITLTKRCQECLLHCAKDRQYEEVSLEWCAKKVCHDVCKTEEE